ncbi:uncharacterized protein E5676_scaffold13G001550 [Cucumis melo var. makuwa]|uniref:Tunicamycin induced 1 n=1 Tax=Cucumis melo var. makuwa TaxID=1194695 RepID=A0A5A7SKZ2_CUCMM|nr:uncharacterized protein E6C27_scaffold139G001560 [Cucumis melo var. makuwa]TYK06851.1 uncharacterized protein E5676_scaffold13G001550 [Cucumis melo var. makuwa]
MVDGFTKDLKEMIKKGLGFRGDDFKVSGVDFKDARVGNSVAYEFELEIDNQVFPLKFLENAQQWDYVDLPIFQIQEQSQHEDKNLLAQKRNLGSDLPVLSPFQLAGPMELWIQDADGMRVSLPHDVDAGVLRKVVLADGAVVTVTGARSVSLRQPLDLPLPLNRTTPGFATGLVALAEQLRHTSRSQSTPLLSLRIVGPTSLTSSPSSTNKLKLKRLAPGLVELSSPIQAIQSPSPVHLQPNAPTILTPKAFTTLWPITSINGSNSKLVGFETLLTSLLGPKANRKGSFKLLKANVSAQTTVRIGFGVDKKLEEGDGIDMEGFPEWRTKPEAVRLHFEVLATLDGERIIPERVMPVKPVIVEDTVAPNVLLGNVSMSKTPIVYTPSDPFTL